MLCLYDCVRLIQLRGCKYAASYLLSLPICGTSNRHPKRIIHNRTKRLQTGDRLYSFFENTTLNSLHSNSCNRLPNGFMQLNTHLTLAATFSAIFITGVIGMLSCATYMSVMVSFVHYQGVHGKRPPVWLKKLILYHGARLLCMSDDHYYKQCYHFVVSAGCVGVKKCNYYNCQIPPPWPSGVVSSIPDRGNT